MSKNLKIVSLFCGCGGSDLGLTGGFQFLAKEYKKLPVDIVFACDNDPHTVETYNENFKHKAIVKDVRDCKKETLPNFDLLVAGFPCQSFSTVNPTKDPFDKRAKLYNEVARILEEKQPSFFIAENVKGMVVLKKGEIFKKILKKFSSKGYEITHHLINTADYGVPQRRERVFMVGVHKKIGFRYKFPDATHSKAGKDGASRWEPLSKVIDSLIPDDGKYYFSKKAVRGMKNAKNNMKRGLYQDLNLPCLTITSHLAKVSLNSRDPVLLVDRDKELYRRFTPLEAARIQSFPDSFKFMGSEAKAYKQIGNAISPVVMWHIARGLFKQIEEKEKSLSIEGIDRPHKKIYRDKVNRKSNRLITK